MTTQPSPQGDEAEMKKLAHGDPVAWAKDYLAGCPDQILAPTVGEMARYILSRPAPLPVPISAEVALLKRLEWSGHRGKCPVCLGWEVVKGAGECSGVHTKDCELDRLLRASPAETGWRPIESAPKDGTRILLSNGHIGRWAKWKTSKSPRWVMERRSNNDQWPDQNPTHWMPLPAPPSTAQQEGE